MHWYCALKTHLTHKFIRKCKNSCDIHSFIGSYFIRQNIHPCVKRVFNAWYSCVKCTNLWMNEFHTIFILNSSHGKFAKYLLLWFALKTQVSINSQPKSKTFVIACKASSYGSYWKKPKLNKQTFIYSHHIDHIIS
jgi:hypothetical protein